jgi:hypothetical protein
MRKRAVFVEVEALQRSRRGSAVSALALEVHVRAVDHSAHSECPAFISDDGLDAIASGHVTTMAAIELCLAELWHRAQGGYVLADLDLITRLGSARVRWSQNVIAACKRTWAVLNRDNFIPL